MCGITGIINFNENLLNTHKIIENMTASLLYRGPDSEGFFKDKNVLLGHRRLIVVDPSGGIQPMSKTINLKKYVLIYNGELYNTDELRSELISAGFSFESYSDTEVLIYSYIYWKENCVNHLNGIFAFSIWDEYENKLFIARDHLGVKPLFYTIANNNFVFASEIKALLSHPLVKAILDEQSILELFSLGPATPLGSGVLKNIKEIPPAHYGILTNSSFKLKEYWKLPVYENTENLLEATEHLRTLLIDSIERQLVGDVPICSFLSGGLDSSAISAIASRYFKSKGKELSTYSINYEDNNKYFESSLFQPSSDEYWTDIMAKYINSNHTNVVLSNSDLVNFLKDATIARDLPGMADIDSSLLLFCKEIRKNFVVGLSGECADELFGGYPWYTRPELINSDTFPWSTSVKERSSLLNPSIKHLNFDDYSRTQYVDSIKNTPLLDTDTQEEKRMRELFYLNIKWFMINLLNRKDRMSMRTSLEVRVPFADYRLVEYAFNLPSKLKFADGREKGLLRRALIGVLPNEIINRKKSPYPKTFHPIYTSMVCNELQLVIDNSNSPINCLIDKNSIQELINTKGSSYKTPWYGQLMTGPQLIAYFIQLNYWLENYNINIQI